MSIKVGVIRGGPSSEYEVSLKTGGNVLKFLPEKYKAVDILITKNGEWHLNGVPGKPENIFRYIDIAFNATHGEFGEDGQIQRIFEYYKIPYTGSGVVASAIAMNKWLSRKAFMDAGIKIPRAFLIKKEEKVQEAIPKIFQAFSSPWVIKPTSKGSSVGVQIVRYFEDLKKAIEDSFKHGSAVIVEEYINGLETTCGVLEKFRGESFYAFPAVEIIPPKNNFFDYKSKYDGSTIEICPSRFSAVIKKEIENLAKKAHNVLGCGAYSRSDFIISRKGIFILETNTLPGLTSESLLPKSALAVGFKFPDLLDHLIKLALNKFR